MDSYVVYAAMDFFGMTSPHVVPMLNKIQSNGTSILKEKVRELVNRSVDHFTSSHT